jgi:hypothetical protein
MSLTTTEVPMFGLSLNETLTLGIAVYAAAVSTFVLGWDAYKWLNQGPKVRISAQTGMRVMGGIEVDPKTYVSITAVNYGDRATTITNMGFLYYKSWFRAVLRRNRADSAFVVATPSQAQRIPYRFEAGAQWIGMADQTEDVDAMVRDGYLYAVLYCSTAGKGIRKRLQKKGHSAAADATDL